MSLWSVLAALWFPLALWALVAQIMRAFEERHDLGNVIILDAARARRRDPGEVSELAELDLEGAHDPGGDLPPAGA